MASGEIKGSALPEAFEMSTNDSIISIVGGVTKIIKKGNLFIREEDIGIMGTLGACVGICSNPPSYMSEMSGTRIKGTADYGNYMHTASGSIMVYIPKHYVKIVGNVYSVASIYDFKNETVAATSGYFLPRCFIDGGVVLDGYFYDKYPLNGVESNVAVSKQGLVPITSSGAITTYGFADCTANGQAPTNTYGGALAMSKSRGNDFFTPTSFHDFDLFCLVKAHQQALTASDTTYAAWNNVSPYFPKGNNNNALADVNDTSVVFTTALNADYAQRAKTGSGLPFAKTTHNGQVCGIADLNGNMWRISIGLTYDSTNIKLYTLKESIVFKNLIDSTTDANGAFNIAAFDSIGANPSAFLQIGGTAGWEGLGNSTNQVFSGETDRTLLNYRMTNVGLPQPTGHIAAGTADFGNDQIYVPTAFPNTLCVLAGGTWGNGTDAGVGCRNLNGSRAGSGDTVGACSCLSHVNV